MLTGSVFLLFHQTEVFLVEAKFLLVPDVIAMVHLFLAGELTVLHFIESVGVAVAALAALAPAVLIGVEWQVELLPLKDVLVLGCVYAVSLWCFRGRQGGVAAVVESVDDVANRVFFFRFRARTVADRLSR